MPVTRPSRLSLDVDPYAGRPQLGVQQQNQFGMPNYAAEAWPLMTGRTPQPQPRLGLGRGRAVASRPRGARPSYPDLYAGQPDLNFQGQDQFGYFPSTMLDLNVPRGQAPAGGVDPYMAAGGRDRFGFAPATTPQMPSALRAHDIMPVDQVGLYDAEMADLEAARAPGNPAERIAQITAQMRNQAAGGAPPRLANVPAGTNIGGGRLALQPRERAARSQQLVAETMAKVADGTATLEDLAFLRGMGVDTRQPVAAAAPEPVYQPRGTEAQRLDLMRQNAEARAYARQRAAQTGMPQMAQYNTTWEGEVGMAPGQVPRQEFVSTAGGAAGGLAVGGLTDTGAGQYTAPLRPDLEMLGIGEDPNGPVARLGNAPTKIMPPTTEERGFDRFGRPTERLGFAAAREAAAARHAAEQDRLALSRERRTERAQQKAAMRRGRIAQENQARLQARLAAQYGVVDPGAAMAMQMQRNPDAAMRMMALQQQGMNAAMDRNLRLQLAQQEAQERKLDRNLAERRLNLDENDPARAARGRQAEAEAAALELELDRAKGGAAAPMTPEQLTEATVNRKDRSKEGPEQRLKNINQIISSMSGQPQEAIRQELIRQGYTKEMVEGDIDLRMFRPGILPIPDERLGWADIGAGIMAAVPGVSRDLSKQRVDKIRRERAAQYQPIIDIFTGRSR